MSHMNPRSIRLTLLVVLLLLLSPFAQAAEPFFVNPAQVNLAAMLAPPPAVGSPVQQAEIKRLLALQSSRTPEEAAFALADAERSVLRFADVLGPNFTEEKCPKTIALFTAARKNTDAIVNPAKALFHRPRPYVASGEIHPCLPKPNNDSYPSGHSTFASQTAVLLTNMVPEKQAEIFARAELYRDNRMIGGVHYPSDIEAGRISGTVAAALLLQDAAFKTELEEAKKETRGALGM